MLALPDGRRPGGRLARFTRIGVAVAILSVAPSARAAGDRVAHGLLSPARKPVGVPANYVLTHNGFFHPSCVVVVDSDEIVGGDGVIRGIDGAERDRIAPCPYARYTVTGRAVGLGESSSAEAAPAHAPPAVTYDGYIVYYSYFGDFAAEPSLSTRWTVPLAPQVTTDQDIAFFNDILTTSGGGDILQPVLDWNGEVRNHWAIESEHCCVNNNDMQTTPVDVNAGDVILGTVAGTGCDGTGACSAWSVTTTDTTTGKSTTLNTTTATGIPNGASPGSLETYGVTACDMFPANGRITFTDNDISSPDGAVQNIKYDLLVMQGVAAEVPTNCGYAGTSSGNSYTLIFGDVPDAGMDSAVSSIDAGDASAPVDASVAREAGEVVDASDARDASDIADATTSTDAAESVDATAERDAQSGSDSGTRDSSTETAREGGPAGSSDGSASAHPGEAGSGGNEKTTGASSGCSCRVGATAPSGAGASAIALACALVAARRRKRRRGAAESTRHWL